MIPEACDLDSRGGAWRPCNTQVARNAVWAVRRGAERPGARRQLGLLELDDCLSVLAAAVPTIHAVGEGETLHSLLQSVKTVERWWYPTVGERSNDP